MDAEHLKTKPNTENIVHAHPFFNLCYCHGLFYTKMKEPKEHAFNHVYQDTKTETTNQMASYLSIEENRKESTLQNQLKHHLN